jgi:hypothetical protein
VGGLAQGKEKGAEGTAAAACQPKMGADDFRSKLAMAPPRGVCGRNQSQSPPFAVLP